MASTTITPSPFPSSPNNASTPSIPQASSSWTGSRLKARPVPQATFNNSLFANQPSSSSSTNSSPNIQSTPSFTPLQPTQSTFTPLQPTRTAHVQAPIQSSSGPNYNISLTPSAPSPRPTPMSFMSSPPQPQPQAPIAPQVQAQSRPPPGYSSGLMQPTVASKPSIPTVNGKIDWGDFDPLK
jgi:SCY1-like protein 2